MSGKTITITTVSKLDFGTSYVLTLPEKSVKDVTGNELNTAYSLTFTTGNVRQNHEQNRQQDST